MRNKTLIQPVIHHRRDGKFEWSVNVWRQQTDAGPSFSIQQTTHPFASETEANADMEATLALLNILP